MQLEIYTSAIYHICTIIKNMLYIGLNTKLKKEQSNVMKYYTVEMQNLHCVIFVSKPCTESHATRQYERGEVTLENCYTCCNVHEV